MIVAPNAFPIVSRDAVALNYRVTLGANGDAGVLVVTNFVALQGSLTLVVDVDTGFAVVVNGVQANDGIRPVLDDDAFASILKISLSSIRPSASRSV